MPDVTRQRATATRRLVRVLAASRRPVGSAAAPATRPDAAEGHVSTVSQVFGPPAMAPAAMAPARAATGTGAARAGDLPDVGELPDAGELAGEADPVREVLRSGRGQAGGAPSGGSDRSGAGDLPDAGGPPGEDPDPAPGLLARLSPAGAFDPGRSGRRGLAAVAAVVVLGAALLAWWSRPQPEPVPPIAVTTTGVPAPTTPTEVVVAVSGMVHDPGLVRLPSGARVADALAAAGGPLPDADLDHLNLARKVTDGELITVGIPPPAGEPAGSPAGDPGGPAGGLVNLNTATQAELETLPGIGPALAQRIIDYRTQHGPFRSVAELRQVSGIGEVRFAELQDLVTV